MFLGLEKIDLNRNFPTWADVNKTVEELFEGQNITGIRITRGVNSGIK